METRTMYNKITNKATLVGIILLFNAISTYAQIEKRVIGKIADKLNQPVNGTIHVVVLTDCVEPGCSKTQENILTGTIANGFYTTTLYLDYTWNTFSHISSIKSIKITANEQDYTNTAISNRLLAGDNALHLILNFQMETITKVNSVSFMNARISNVYPTGNFVKNSSFENERIGFHPSACNGWLLNTGEFLERRKVEHQHVVFMKENDGILAAYYVISDEEPLYQTVLKAKSDGKKLFISVWLNPDSEDDEIRFRYTSQYVPMPAGQWSKLTGVVDLADVEPIPGFDFEYFAFGLESYARSTITTWQMDNFEIFIDDGEYFNKRITKLDYVSGMGRIEQSQSIFNSADGLNRTVKKSDFDALGRSLLDWKLGGEDCSFLDCYDISTIDINDFYNSSINPGHPDADGFAYGEKIWEPDPLGRSFKSARPGLIFSKSQTVFRNSINSYNGTSDLEVPGESNVENPYFSYAHVLSPDKNEYMSWKDAFGNEVKTSVKLAGGLYSSTHKIYDERGNTVKVISPSSCVDRSGNPTGIEKCVDPVTFSYDIYGRLIKEKHPAAGTTKNVFDRDGKLRFFQTQSQRNDDVALNRFSFIKYDRQSRIIRTGEVIGKMMSDFDKNKQDQPADNHPNANVKTYNFYDEPQNLSPVCGENIGKVSYSNELIFIIFESGSGSEPSNPYEFKTIEEMLPAAKTIYDGLEESKRPKMKVYQLYIPPQTRKNYTIGLDIRPIQLDDGSELGFRLAGLEKGGELHQTIRSRMFYQDLEIDWGYFKGRLVKTATCNYELAEYDMFKEILTLYNYDKKGNVIETYEYNGYVRNSANELQLSKMKYSPDNRLIEKTVCNGLDCDNAIVKERYEYDGALRLSEVADILDPDNPKIKQISIYNKIGQLKESKMGKDLDANTDLSVTYSYSLHDAMKTVEAKSKILDEDVVSEYSLELDYENNPIGTNRYDGLISFKDENYHGNIVLASPGNYWQTFTYDQKSQLKEVGSGFREMTMSYDYYEDGRIKSIFRENQEKQGTFHYDNSHKGMLQSVSGNLVPFRDMGDANNFVYDDDGKLISDLSKDLNIIYNAEGLPIFFELDNYKYFMAYHNDSRASKIEHNEAGYFKSKHYFSSGKKLFEYEDEEDEENNHIAMGAGRRVKSSGDGSWMDEYFIRDYLNTTKMVYNTSSNAITYVANYYPYGKTIFETETPANEVTPKFTGKEHDEGIELSFFGARYYDADIGLWISPDPGRQHHSLYTYASNNPINRFDPDGWEDVYYLLGSSYLTKKDFTAGMGSSIKAYEAKKYTTKVDYFNKANFEAALADDEAKYIYILGHNAVNRAGIKNRSGVGYVTPENLNATAEDIQVINSGCRSQTYQTSWWDKIKRFIGLQDDYVGTQDAMEQLNNEATFNAEVLAPEKKTKD